METHLSAVPTEPAERAEIGDSTPSFEAFYEATFARLFAGLCLITGNRHEAEEIAQDAYLKMFERWDRVDTLDDPVAYLFRTSMNLFRSRSRRAALGLRRVFWLAPDETDDLAEVETRDAIVRLLRGLTPRERAAVVLTAIMGYPAEEAGPMLGLRPSSIRSLTTRARARMQHEGGDRHEA